jgi:hypothetical protein
MIDTDDYKFISDEVGGALDDATKSSRRVLDMRNDLNISEVDDQNYDKLRLANAIDAVYAIVLTKYSGDTQLMSTFIRRLQEHVTHHYGSVNGFLLSNAIRVPQSFADLSAKLGFSIDIGNII